MSDSINKQEYGFNPLEFEGFCDKNPNIPKGTFQIKQRGSSYYWYYTLSINTADRVKYLSKAFKTTNGKNKIINIAIPCQTVLQE